MCVFYEKHSLYVKTQMVENQRIQKIFYVINYKMAVVSLN